MQLGASKDAGWLSRIWSRPERRLQIVALVVGLGIVLAGSAFWLLVADVADIEFWKGLGYPGVLMVAFFGSVSMVLPVPGLLTLCGASLVLDPFVLGLLAGVGEALGEMSGYAVGYGGGSILERRKFYPKLRRWMERRGILVLFLASAVPNPFFDLVGIAAGGVRFPLLRFIVTVWVGKTVKSMIVGYTCFYGVTLLPWVQ